MYKTKILADKISNLTDARYFSARYCDGICFEIPDISDVSKGIFLINSIKEWVAGPDIYIRSNGLGKDDVSSVINEVDPAGIIVSFFDDYDLSVFGTKYLIREIIMEADSHFDLMHVDPRFSAVMLDVSNTQLLADKKFTDKLQELSDKHEVYLKSDNFEALGHAVFRMPFLSGIGVNGGSELKTGLKSFDEIDALLDSLEG